MLRKKGKIHQKCDGTIIATVKSVKAFLRENKNSVYGQDMHGVTVSLLHFFFKFLTN